MIKSKYLIFVLALVIPYFIIYKSFFSTSPLAWGDAPFYYPQNLRELVNFPQTWNFRNDNFGAPQGYILWLYLLSLVQGVLGSILKLPTEIVSRVIFYFPATLLSIIGAWLFLTKFTKNIKAIFLGCFLYGFNTYNLVLIDGGQVGVGLSYGLFPLAIYFLFNFFQKNNTRNFLLSLLTLFLLINSDIRTFLLSLSFIFFWFSMEVFAKRDKFINFKKKPLFLLFIALLGLNSFWIIPTLIIRSQALINLTPDPSSFISILNSFYLFQPHFPLNEFGRIVNPPFYFAFLPVLFLSGLLINYKGLSKKFFLGWVVFFLIYVFLAKGENKPIGDFYVFLVNSLPLGVAFRDSSKFFIPLILSASILLALSYERIDAVINEKKLNTLFLVSVYLYLSLLIHPAILGKLSGNLGQNYKSDYFEKIYQNLKGQEDFFRTLWFDEKPQQAFSSWNHPSISAINLFQERPFASMIEGSYDLYNFLHNPQLSQWFDLLGIKYVFYPENERKKIRNDKDLRNRQLFLRFVDSLSGFSKKNWDTNFPIYQTTTFKPHIFGQNKVFLILGGEEIYEKLFSVQNFSLAAQGLIFLEDGKFDPNQLFSLDSKSAQLIFVNKKNDLDLAMTFLQDKMISVKKANFSKWALRDSKDYLKWKDELSNFGFDTKEFDYNKGLAYSTRRDELISFENKLKKDRYFIALRYANASDSAGMEVKVNNFKKDLKNETNGFKWDLVGPIELEGRGKFEIKNLGGTTILNTVALLSEDDLSIVKSKSKKLIDIFSPIRINSVDSLKNFANQLERNIVEIESLQKSPTYYKITSPKVKWIIFTDHYHPDWKLEHNSPFPLYSMVNGFYINNLGHAGSELDLYFTPQRWIIKGIILSGISLVLILLIIKLNESKRKN